jgi:hypothetical protein
MLGDDDFGQRNMASPVVNHLPLFDAAIAVIARTTPTGMLRYIIFFGDNIAISGRRSE